MNTPVGSRRTATPRLSESKRQLFKSRSSILEQIDDDDDVDEVLLGISPLRPSHKHKNISAGQNRNGRSLFSKDQHETRSGLRSRSSTSSSPETNKENKSAVKGACVVRPTSSTDEQLPDLFTTTMRIDSNSGTSQSSSPRTPRTRGSVKSKASNSGEKSIEKKSKMRDHEVSNESDDIINLVSSSPSSAEAVSKVRITQKECMPTKRSHEESEDSDEIINVESTPPSEPECKLRRTQEECIPTIAFYSHASKARAGLRSTPSYTPNRRHQRRSSSKGTSPTSRPLGINRGVGHKIRKRCNPSTSSTSTNLDGILGMLRNEKLRNLITTKREERAKVEEVHEILRRAKDPIKMAKPLSVFAQNDDNNNNDNNFKDTSTVSLGFSDLSDEEDYGLNVGRAAVAQIPPDLQMEPVIPLIRHGDQVNTSPPSNISPPGKRKFFKSGRRSSTCKEVRITDNIRASVNNGKIQLMEAPVKMRQVRVKSATIFSAEQATVDAILRNLDETVIDEIIESEPLPPPKTQLEQEQQSTTEPEPEVMNEVEEVEMLEILPADPYAKYRQQLPYQTNDPATMEQQELLLEFLISNNICTDENFKIFIADPDNHKEEATRIVDRLYMVVNAEIESQTTPKEPESTVHSTTEQTTADQSKPQSETQGKLFPIFTQRLQPLPQRSTRRKINAYKQLVVGAAGANQYQIDAGQKAFGARQCQQCGLVYTVHEPEEEQLHREYHSAVHVLRFKGWIDEDIVAVYPDWSADGRIIRMTEQAPAARLQRLTELISIVDKELGYSSYIVPKTFVVFFAVRKHQIVGLCIVQPLTEAHRFIQVDGTDYLSEETFEAR